MAATGRHFLYVMAQDELQVSAHALDRLAQYTGAQLGEDAARMLFTQARHVRWPALGLLGYRPNYQGRKAKGIDSWYFRFAYAGTDCLAVITRDEGTGALVWVTTYAQAASVAAPRIELTLAA